MRRYPLMKMTAAAVLILSALSTAGCRTDETRRSDAGIPLNGDLLSLSACIDVVREDGKFSRVLYLAEEDCTEGALSLPCLPEEQRPRTQGRGIWIWQWGNVIGKEEYTIERLKSLGITRVYLQIGPDLELVAGFVGRARSSGMDVYALDGAPDYIRDYNPLIGHVARIKAYNETHGEAGFRGVQVDVEPYVLEDFSLRKHDYAKKYLAMAADLRKAAGEDLRLSFVLPFWFDTLIVNGRPLSDLVTDLGDEVVLMSYRTEYREVVESACHELRYAQRAGKPVLLGLELTRLPREEHLVLSRDEVLRHAEAREGALLLRGVSDGHSRPVRRYTVKPEKVSFWGNRHGVESVLEQVPPYQSFFGYVIHSYDALNPAQ